MDHVFLLADSSDDEEWTCRLHFPRCHYISSQNEGEIYCDWFCLVWSALFDSTHLTCAATLIHLAGQFGRSELMLHLIRSTHWQTIHLIVMICWGFAGHNAVVVYIIFFQIHSNFIFITQRSLMGILYYCIPMLHYIILFTYCEWCLY